MERCRVIGDAMAAQWVRREFEYLRKIDELRSSQMDKRGGWTELKPVIGFKNDQCDERNDRLSALAVHNASPVEREATNYGELYAILCLEQERYDRAFRRRLFALALWRSLRCAWLFCWRTNKPSCDSPAHRL